MVMFYQSDNEILRVGGYCIGNNASGRQVSSPSGGGLRRGRRSFYSFQLLQDYLHNGVNFLPLPGYSKTQHRVSVGLQPTRAYFVIFSSFRMAAAIKLDHEALLEAEKLHDVVPDRLLSSEFVAA